ncbi:hypothetical protein [Agromyces lapidis]|uniref:Protein kinase domain-containing protein n=1 Tax=Agromyces lapidis TaxID=279574 RepID=A0ABV5SUB2_9MICO|nr:hypothetical protein [Agromyces lapidis]
MRRHSRRRRDAATATHTVPAPGPAPESSTGDDRAVISGYRLLRRLASGDRAAVFLASSLHPAQAASPRPVVALRIYEAGGDDARVAAEISAMTADATGTLPALIDVTALDDGRCVLAVERIAGPTLARLLTERTLDPGEAVTVLAPIAVAVAGLAEAGFVHTRLAPNDVLIDGAGRPRLIGLGAIRRLDEVSSAIERTELLRAGHSALSDLVAAVAEATRPLGSLDRAVAAISDAASARPFVRSEALLERTLFESAVAAPVRGIRATAQLGAAPARLVAPATPGAVGLSGAPEPHGRADDAKAGAVTVPSRRRGLLGTLAALAQVPADAFEHGAELADVDPVRSFTSRLGRGLLARRRAVLVAGLVGGAALVLLLTLVPPADEHVAGDAEGGAGPGGAAAAPGGAAEGAAESETTAEGDDRAAAHDDSAAGATVEAEGGPVEDPIEAAAALLALREDCFGALDAACLEQVDQAGSAIERADLAKLSGAREGVTVEPTVYALDEIAVTAEMGDAVLVTVPYADPEREPASLLVMRSEAGWRLRELFD